MRRRFEIAIGKIKAKVPPEKGSLSYFPFVGKEYEMVFKKSLQQGVSTQVCKN
jgi:hypothetical protein